MLTVASMSFREILRRRGVLVLMIALPLALYLVRRELPGQSVRFLALGIGWAVSTLALFGACAARPAEVRLRLTGMSTRTLVTGRLLAVQAAGIVLASGYFAVVALDQNVRRVWGIAVLLAVSALVAGPVGALLGVLVPRELEGALALLLVASTQMLANPDGAVAPWLPFWSSRQLATYAIDGTATSDLVTGLLHATAVIISCLVIATLVSSTRLRLISWPAPAEAAD
jgi:hypothetical protein